MVQFESPSSSVLQDLLLLLLQFASRVGSSFFLTKDVYFDSVHFTTLQMASEEDDPRHIQGHAPILTDESRDEPIVTTKELLGRHQDAGEIYTHCRLVLICMGF